MNKIEGRMLIVSAVAGFPDDYCCNQMNFHMNYKEKIILYDAANRCYLFKINDTTGQIINYCPWCASKLPENLITQRARIIFDQLHFADYDDPDIPSEFRSDEWWKKRGL